MTAVLEAADVHLTRFAEVESSLCGAGLPWLAKARQEAISRFEKMGFPAEGNEDWRFTRVDPIVRTSFALPGTLKIKGADVKRNAVADFEAYRLVFVDGRLAPSLSCAAAPQGARICGLAEELKAEPALLETFFSKPNKDEAFAALNTAFFDDGALIWLPQGVKLDKPVHLLFISTACEKPVMWNGRILVAAEEGSKLSLVEEYAGAQGGVYFANMITEISVHKNSAVEYVKIQRDSERSFHVSGLRVRQDRDSVLSAHSVSLGAALCRNDVSVSLVGAGADCSLDGLYLADGKRHVDFHTRIDHEAPHCSSRELFKGVLDGSARAVFNGMVQVMPQAQKTSAMVYNKNLLLSEEGLVNTKPEFKIHANDVQCKHGATIGQLSENALFYLKSRGIDSEAARRLLVYAFGREMLEKIAEEPVREALSRILASSFGGRD